jgi:hypothetical protein
MPEEPTKAEKLKQIIDGLKTGGHRLSDEDLAQLQLKTDALRRAAGDHEHHSDHAAA